MGDFTEILLRQGVISPDQLTEAEAMARESAMNVSDALVRLGYATGDEVMRAIAAEHHLDFVNLEEVTIPPSVIELVPESVARENVILPMADEDDSLRVIASDPLDLDTFDKLRFILNRKIDIAVAPRESILQAINQYYGSVEGESADSMLQDFTDTAIDFTETDSLQDEEDEDVDESSAPIVRLAHLIINEAVQLRASDIHIEPFEDRVRIRYRIDGVFGRTRQSAATPAGRIALAPQNHGADGHRRTPPYARRSNQGNGRRKGTRSTRQHVADEPRPVVCHAVAGQGQYQDRCSATGAF